MKKNSSKGYVILGILFVLVSVIAFAVPLAKTAAFWISYAFTVIAFAAQIVIWKAALGRAESLKSKFLGFPVVHIGMVYLVVQIIAFAVFSSSRRKRTRNARGSFICSALPQSLSNAVARLE